MTNDKFMFKDENELRSLQGGVFGYLQRDINRLFESKHFDAEFMNFAQSQSENTSWIYLRVYYTWYKDADDMLGTYDSLKIAYRVGINLYTRDNSVMSIVDRMAGLNRIKNKLSDINLVKLRILYSIGSIIESIQTDNVPSNLLPTKKWIVVRQKDDGSLSWTKENDAPGI